MPRHQWKYTINNMVKFKKQFGMTMREGTSDIKAYNEVIKRKAYEKFGFSPEAGESWLDIGAHIGTFSKLYSERGVKVKSYEPWKESFDLLKINAPLSEHFNFGVGDKAGTRTLYLNTTRGNTWRNSTTKTWQGGGKTEVKILDIMDLISDDINIKMDAEGVEKEIINKLCDTGGIRKVNKLVFEWSFDTTPHVPDFVVCLKKLKKTHKLLNVDNKFIEYFSKMEKFPFFPYGKIIFAVRKTNIK